MQTVTRRATRDLELGPGVVIPKDQTVLLPHPPTSIPRLPGADEVDVRRSDIRAAFGGGPHRSWFSLARMELRTVVRTWHDRI